MIRAERRGERGSVTILLAASITFFFAIAALAVDIGFLYLAQRRAQVIADLAALAGAAKYSTSSAAAISAARAIETANAFAPVDPGFPAGNVEVDLTTPTMPLFFGRMFGLASRSLKVSAIASAPSFAPAIWAGGNCGSPTGLQLNGGPFNIKGDLDSQGPLNYFTSPGENTQGNVTSACMFPLTQGTVTGTVSQAPVPPDPFGYNMFTDFPACTAGDLTTVIVPPAMYNVPNVGGVVAPGVYCANGNVNLSAGGVISNTGAGFTVLATGFITVSSSGLNITGPFPGANNIVFFSNYTTTDCTTQAINLGFPGGTLDGSLYAPKGCLQVSGGSYTLNGSVVGDEVQFGGGSNWTVDSTTGGGGGKVGLFK